jgi:hypothetical protein
MFWLQSLPKLILISKAGEMPAAPRVTFIYEYCLLSDTAKLNQFDFISYSLAIPQHSKTDQPSVPTSMMFQATHPR